MHLVRGRFTGFTITSDTKVEVARKIKGQINVFNYLLKTVKCAHCK